MQILYRALVHLLPLVPRPVLRRIASRYIAGETVTEAMAVVRSLHAHGLLTTVDLLGENLDSEESVAAATAEYLKVLDLLADEGFTESQVSVKPTLMGLRLREELALQELEKIVRRAGEHGLSVCLDMEDSSTTDATLRLFRALRESHANVWLAIQAYLHRSREDLDSLLPLRPRVRVCKGIYREPAAIQDRQKVRDNFLALVRLLLEGGGFPAIATHDPWLLRQCRALLSDSGVGPEGHEFQMLLGVGGSLRARLVAAGCRLRIYCPYGPEWRAYSARRFQEHPQMVGYVLRNLFSSRRHEPRPR